MNQIWFVISQALFRMFTMKYLHSLTLSSYSLPFFLFVFTKMCEMCSGIKRGKTATTKLPFNNLIFLWTFSRFHSCTVFVWRPHSSKVFKSPALLEQDINMMQFLYRGWKHRTVSLRRSQLGTLNLIFIMNDEAWKRPFHYFLDRLSDPGKELHHFLFSWTITPSHGKTYNSSFALRTFLF